MNDLSCLALLFPEFCERQWFKELFKIINRDTTEIWHWFDHRAEIRSKSMFAELYDYYFVPFCSACLLVSRSATPTVKIVRTAI